MYRAASSARARLFAPAAEALIGHAASPGAGFGLAAYVTAHSDACVVRETWSPQA
jgi:hypothetical protein